MGDGAGTCKRKTQRLIIVKKLYMRLKKIILLAIPILCCASLHAQVDGDSVLHQRDSVIEVDNDPTTEFFRQGEKISAPSKTILVLKNRKTVSLGALLKSNNMMDADHVLADLDNDGRKELIFYNFTGGAHCCDEIFIYKNIAPNKYQHVARLFGGHTIITLQNEFEFGFYEQFGYFFTCYACGYADSTDGAPIPLRGITLRYTKGKMVVVPGDQELRSTINDNLGKLGEQPYEKLDEELAMDEGLRKEFAMNLAVFYYAFGRNLINTKTLFNKYYKYPDAVKVWTAFSKNLLVIKKDSDF